jgi:hypothetical protein
VLRHSGDAVDRWAPAHMRDMLGARVKQVSAASIGSVDEQALATNVARRPRRDMLLSQTLTAPSSGL